MRFNQSSYYPSRIRAATASTVGTLTALPSRQYRCTKGMGFI